VLDELAFESLEAGAPASDEALPPELVVAEPEPRKSVTYQPEPLS